MTQSHALLHVRSEIFKEILDLLKSAGQESRIIIDPEGMRTDMNGIALTHERPARVLYAVGFAPEEDRNPSFFFGPTPDLDACLQVTPASFVSRKSYLGIWRLHKKTSERVASWNLILNSWCLRKPLEELAEAEKL
jgi:hypothetical protein